ncbi:ABC-2 transporter permease [Dyella sp. 2HG41-7]|uniref:ABC-2 transporter permease n=1 Tax=Dyella sp. 2HG41-7 TaxID=2883239 RepID=UPI001F21ACF6|nr:ABC-2 transporter permease [Dyella sp. 2HG41-7]
MKTLYWLVKREFWEHRGGFIWAPVITGIVFLVLNLMGIVSGEVFGSRHGLHIGPLDGQDIAAKLQSLDAHQMQEVGSALDLAMLSSSGLISVVFAFVVFFYCLGSLYDDRRDRSFLFWKSLPISDTNTVLSKVIAGALIAPIAVVVCGVLTGIAMLLLFAITLSFHGVSVWSLLVLAHPFQMVGFLIGSIPLYLLWALPTVGWLMLCSSWARTKPFLWAVVIPVALGVIISWFNLLGSEDFKSNWYWRDIVARVLFSVFPGGWLHDSAAHQLSKDPESIGQVFSLSNSYAVLASPNIWIGAAAGIAMLGGAVWFRRWRDDS